MINEVEKALALDDLRYELEQDDILESWLSLNNDLAFEDDDEYSYCCDAIITHWLCSDCWEHC